MLLNQKGLLVPPTRENIENPSIIEKKEVENHRCGHMFKLGTRATYKMSQKKGWQQ